MQDSISALIAKLGAWKEHDFHADRQLADEVLIADGWKCEPSAEWKGGVRWFVPGNPEYSCSEDQRPHVIHDLNTALGVVPFRHNVCLTIINGDVTATVWAHGQASGHEGKSTKATIAVLIAALKTKQAQREAA